MFLTSAGFLNKNIADKFLKEIGKNPDDIKVFMAEIFRTKEEEHYIKESEKELKELGIKEIEIFRYDRKINNTELDKFDAVYVCGGNTFLILQKTRETGLDEALISFVNNGGIYVGVSAGSIIVGPSIEIAGWGSEGDKNDINLNDLKGLNLVSFLVFPHFKPQFKEEAEEFKKKTSYPVITLTDDQAIFIDGEKETMIC